MNDKQILLQSLRVQYDRLYHNNSYTDASASFEKLVSLMDDYKWYRKPELQSFDTNGNDWYLSENTVAMTLYVDLFAGNLEGVKSHIDYFKDLGITLIHFMPLLQGRPGENDGGYAVANYKAIDAKFGTLKQFEELVSSLRKEGIHSCIDFVVNHTAKEHAWAVSALSGNQDAMNLYMMYPDRTIPDRFEKTVPEVFPTVSPGNFNYYPEIDRHVFTSFYEFQWDLNFNNPEVFHRIVDILLHIANLGVDMIRLDAIPFMWKELETTCRNLPNVHVLLDMFNTIISYVCPSVVLLGEAIVEPEEIVKYFGTEHQECQMMYNATFMVNIWNAIATRDIRLMTIDQSRLHPGFGGCWINYARCHDDIGWGFNEEATRSIGLDPYFHKQFLIQFFEGQHEDSFSKGELYEFDEKTMDARNSGTLASLCGLETSSEYSDQYQQELAIKRIILIHSLVIASRGIPLIYSGDELATVNAYDYKEDDSKAHDSRWLHRIPFDWNRAARRNDAGTVEGNVFQAIKKLIAIRKGDTIFSSAIDHQIIDTQNQHVYCMAKEQDGRNLVALFNFSEYPQVLQNESFLPQHLRTEKKDLYQGKSVNLAAPKTLLGPYEFLLLI